MRSPGTATPSGLSRQCRRAAARKRSSPPASAPVGRIGTGALWLLSVNCAPDADQQAEAVATDALSAALMAIGRTDPTAGLGNDLGRHSCNLICHGTIGPPSKTPLSLA